jgi:hypothetical protein
MIQASDSIVTFGHNDVQGRGHNHAVAMLLMAIFVWRVLLRGTECISGVKQQQ